MGEPAWRRALALARRHPHGFTLQYPPSRELFRQRYRAPFELAGVASLRRVLLYAHVPFCEAKCFYCNFAVDLRKDAALHARYVDALCVQLERLYALLPEGAVIAGIDVGGGTPTLLAAPLLERLARALAPFRARAEVPHAASLETTPRVAATEPEKLALLVRCGFDRCSVGLQSTNDETLASVNRRAQRSLGERALEGLRGAGFRRVHADLVFGLPGQTLEHLREDLVRVADAGVDSVTTYDCLYRGAGRALPRLARGLPSPELYGALYDLAYELLSARGYHAPYGSVNFSRHAGETGTSPYFEGRLREGLPYLGAGNYASSMVGAGWCFAPEGVDAWEAAVARGEALPAGDSYALPEEERRAKQLLFALHFGVLDAERYRAQFGEALEARYGEPLEYAVERGWLARTPEGYGVCRGAFARLFEVRALFYTEAAVSFLEARGADPFGLGG